MNLRYYRPFGRRGEVGRENIGLGYELLEDFFSLGG